MLMQASFTRYRYELPMLGVFFSIALVELFVVHLLVGLWSPSMAWGLSALTVLGLVQIGLLIQGMMKWPTVVNDNGITVRHGRRGEIFVPFKIVQSVEDVAFRPEQRGLQTFRASLLAQPNVAIRLLAPLPYRKRMLSTISMRLDDPAEFHAAVAAKRATA